MSFKKSVQKNETGFTLLELLLVVGIMGVLILGITQLTQSWVNSEISTGAGQHLQRTANVVQKYIEANYTTLTPTANALAAGGVWQNLEDNLAEEGLLTSGNLRSPLGVDMKIGFVIDTSGVTPIRRATIYSANPFVANRVLDAARKAGNIGGVISAFPDGTQATGAFGQWRIAKNLLLPGAIDPCPASSIPTGTQGCLVGVVTFNKATLTGPYLYREDMGDPSLNTMNTTLFMNSNSILGASDINTNDLEVVNQANLGNTTVSGPATFNGTTTINNGLNVNNGMTQSGGDATFSNNTAFNSTMAATTVNTTNLNATTIQAPTIRTNTLDTQNMVVNNGSVTVDDDINVNGNVNIVGPGSEIFADTVNAGNINANNGAISVGNVNVENTMTINGAIDVTGGTVVVNQLVADECVRINDGTTYQPYGACP